MPRVLIRSWDGRKVAKGDWFSSSPGNYGATMLRVVGWQEPVSKPGERWLEPVALTLHGDRHGRVLLAPVNAEDDEAWPYFPQAFDLIWSD